MSEYKKLSWSWIVLGKPFTLREGEKVVLDDGSVGYVETVVFSLGTGSVWIKVNKRTITYREHRMNLDDTIEYYDVSTNLGDKWIQPCNIVG